MIDIVTISSKGQVVLPKNLRKEAGLDRNDKLLVVSGEGKIVLEKISAKEVEKKMTGLLDYFSSKFEEQGITKEDIEKEIRAVRKKND